MAEIEILSVVALVEDLPGEGFVRGQVGTVVENWTPGVYEVEFSDDDGKAYAVGVPEAYCQSTRGKKFKPHPSGRG